MRRFACVFAILFTFASGASAGPAVRPATWSRADAADLDRISTYLNTVTTMRGEFLQTGPNGDVDQGTFYIMKPGKMRFDYKPPNPTLVVSNGISVTVYNTKLNTADRYPLSMTPLNILLSTHNDLKRNPYVVSIEHQQGELVVNARSNDRRVTGNITIVFAEPNLELRQWTVVDAQGLNTIVSLRNTETGVSLSPAIFGAKDSGAKGPDGGTKSPPKSP